MHAVYETLDLYRLQYAWGCLRASVRVPVYVKRPLHMAQPAHTVTYTGTLHASARSVSQTVVHTGTCRALQSYSSAAGRTYAPARLRAAGGREPRRPLRTCFLLEIIAGCCDRDAILLTCVHARMQRPFCEFGPTQKFRRSLGPLHAWRVA